MASDAKPESPPAADPHADDAKDEDPGREGQDDKAAEEEPQSGRKRGRRKKGEAEKVSPATPTVERPSRERRRSSATLSSRRASLPPGRLWIEAEGHSQRFLQTVKKKGGRESPESSCFNVWKEIKCPFLEENISQFSGFVWTDNQEKHRARIKEKLDRFNKEKLLDFCEILDIHVSKATTKKEEVSAKLLEFLESPCITRDLVLTDKKKGKKRGRRSKGSSQAAAEGASEEKKRTKKRKQSVEAVKENADEDDEGPAGSEDASMGEEDDEDSEAKNNAGSDEEPDEPPAKKKTIDGKQTKKSKEKDASGKKSSTKPAKAHKKDVAKASNTKKGKGQGNAEARAAPTPEELHAVVSDILKEVDFNTATLADILRQLGTHFKMDLMDRNPSVGSVNGDTNELVTWLVQGTCLLGSVLAGEVQVEEEAAAAAAAVVELAVKRGEPSLVAPAEETTRGLYYLSNLDQNIAVIVQTVYCFTADGAAACAT
ncbi:hypothetical protein GUJ93_ZPchr0001g29881 [Zizania palustris]|uniref:DEK-C domain-containing protein n=1 Tax=Zizania palustris TaxID=103762 RepID=A0A8J5V8E8_ZIZPA|nr:hypothetical protein GUJ93_ZPchr0001g29881 [Zizania palustris]